MGYFIDDYAPDAAKDGTDRGKLFELIKVVGNVHFILPTSADTKNELYIATEKVKFTDADKMTLESVISNAMILVDFLKYFLRLQDIGESGENFGQTDEGNPVIVNFWVTHKDDYVLSDEEIQDFWNTQSTHSCHSQTQLIGDVLKNVTNDERKSIISEAINKWNLINSLEDAKTDFVSKNKDKLKWMGI